MKVISVIEDEEIVKKILKHLGLWDRNPPNVRRIKTRPPPKATGLPKVQEYSVDYSMSQRPYFPDTVSDEAGSDKWFYVDPEYPKDYPSEYPVKSCLIFKAKMGV